AKKSIRTAKTAILCEGNIDVLACSQAGFEATVASLGTSFTTDQARLIKRSADSLIILFDGDDAGRSATMKAAIVAENAGLTVKSALIPQNTDPAELLLEKGPSSLKNILENPINIFSYLLDFLISAKSVKSGEAQEEALEKLTPYLEAVGSDVRREAYLRQLADAMNAHPATVITEYGNRKKPRHTMRRTEKSDDDVRRIDVKTVGEELYLMTAVAVRTEYFTTLRKMLAPELLRDRRALAVYRVLDELGIDGNIPQTQVVVDRLQDDDLKNFILEKASTEIYDERAEETILHKIRLLLERSLKEERIELVKGLARNDADNPEIQNALLTRIREIDMEILKIRQGEDGGNQV
ncbi:MAG: toprim domain-containing protein, partial [Spirochaetaceae bacterium]|nr:toprim domain-containing protein [Spirochaetaceae bacterium]